MDFVFLSVCNTTFYWSKETCFVRYLNETELFIGLQVWTLQVVLFALGVDSRFHLDHIRNKVGKTATLQEILGKVDLGMVNEVNVTVGGSILQPTHTPIRRKGH